MKKCGLLTGNKMIMKFETEKQNPKICFNVFIRLVRNARIRLLH